MCGDLDYIFKVKDVSHKWHSTNSGHMQFRYVSYADTRELLSRHSHLRAHVPFVPSDVEMNHFSTNDFVPADLEKNRHITNDFPVFCYMLDGDKVSAHFSSFPDRLYSGNSEYRWAWCGHLFTNPEYRGKGIASALVREQVSLFHSKNLAWGGVFSTPTAIRIYERLGFSVLGYVPRYFMIKNVSPVVRHHFANSFFIRTLERTYETCFQIARRMLYDQRAFFRDYTIDVEEVEALNAEHCNIKYSERYHFDDSEAMVCWKMGARKIDQLYIVRSRRTGNKVLYLLVRRREIKKRPLLGKYTGLNLMSVMDYGCFDLEASISDAIISSTMALFFASESDACEIISSDPNVCRSARRHGMMRIGMGMSFAYCVPSNWKLGSGSADLHQWHLTHYRGDGFGFE
jgi:GNAT superfamily N-acetyltransferase